jgi:hypothetical protein
MLWVAALAVAEVTWIRWTRPEDEAGWLASLTCLPETFQASPLLLLAGLLGAGFGAHSAWVQLRLERKGTMPGAPVPIDNHFDTGIR